MNDGFFSNIDPQQLVARMTQPQQPSLEQILHLWQNGYQRQAADLLRRNPPLMQQLMQAAHAQPPIPRGAEQYRTPLPGGFRDPATSGEFPVAGTPATGNEGR